MLKKIMILNILLIILLSSCNIISEPKSTDLFYSINFDNSRTLIPVFSGEIDYYTIEGLDSTEANRIEQTITSETGIIEDITEGTWYFTVIAYDSSDNILASGSGSEIVSWGKTNSTLIPMNYIQYYSQVATGDFSAKINWPSYIDVDKVELTWFGEDVQDIDVSGESTYTFMKQDITSGSNYKFLLRFYSSEEIFLFSVSEAVHIYDNKTTSKTITLSEDNFSIPTDPTNVVVDSFEVIDGYDDSLNLSWDYSNDAEYYQVYYSYEPSETVWSDDPEPVDLSLAFTVTNEAYYQLATYNNQTIEIELPSSGSAAYLDETEYTIGNSANLIIEIRVTAVNNYGESDGETITYTTTEVF